MPEVNIEFFGVSFARITTEEGLKVVMDPFIEGNPDSPVTIDDFLDTDLLCVTHSAPDHLGNTLEIMKKSKATLICDPAVALYLQDKGIASERINAKVWGDVVHFKDLKVKLLQTAHISLIKEQGKLYTGIPSGFIVETESGIRVYNAGDTSIFSDLKLFGNLYRPQVALLPVSHPPMDPEAIHLSPYEAALAAKWLGVKNVLPTHYVKGAKEIDLFVQYLEQMHVNCEANLIQPGDNLRLEYSQDELVPSDYYMNIALS